MRKQAAAIMMALAISVAGAYAGPGAQRLPGLTADEILAAAPGVANKTPAELTVGENLAIASAFSVSMQEAMYVHHAGAASLLFPGAGQAMTGSVGGALLQAGAELLIHGATMAGVWYLTPAELKDFSLTMEERKAAAAVYMTPERIGEVLPVMGVAFGGFALSTLNRLFSAGSAVKAAESNIADGSVSFEPILGPSSIGGGMKIRLH
jgi:hypothetical protein